MYPSLLRKLGTSLLLALGIISANTANARSNVDVGLYQNGSQLEVRVKPESDFNGIFSSIVFTIRWSRNSNAVLGELQQDEATRTYMPLQRSGGIRQDAGSNYQVFAGFGFTDLATAGRPWKAGQEYTIAVIPFTGEAEFELATDTWTKRESNNAEYYVSLGGEDRTGIIYKGLAGVAGNEAPFSILPNPNHGQFTITIPVRAGENMWFELVNSAGQVVYQEVPNAGEDAFRKDLDIGHEGAGVYHLRIHREGATENHRVVVN